LINVILSQSEFIYLVDTTLKTISGTGKNIINNSVNLEMFKDYIATCRELFSYEP
jgi:hypothetical protein